jgi:hypothetical protein
MVEQENSVGRNGKIILDNKIFKPTGQKKSKKDFLGF